MKRSTWMLRVANLLGERVMPVEWAKKADHLYDGGIGPSYAAEKMREWLALDRADRTGP